MCTVSFLPLPNSGFILTSNRDEQLTRKPALAPQQYRIHDTQLYFPKDQQASGTWIVSSECHFTLCLLNGGFQAHTPNPPYRLSRGLMVLDFFQYKDVAAFTESYDFNGIEPFTLIIIDSKSDLKLTELRWTGSELFVSPKSETEAHIWSSSTLYSDTIIANRQNWFKEWLNSQTEFDQDSIVHFHTFGGSGDKQNDFNMARNNVFQTVSITSILKNSQEYRMQYSDLVANTHSSLSVLSNTIS